MAKNTLFRRSLFGYAKEDVNDYILQQNNRVRELSEALASLEEKFNTYQAFYANLMRVYDENLVVLREVQIRAAQSEDRVRALSEVFGLLSGAYQTLYRVASEQQAALVTAKLYESKATKYDALAMQMKELVLPDSMREQGAPLAPLPEVGALPSDALIRDLGRRADEALREMLADAQAFFLASARLQNPTPPENSTQNVG